MQESNISYKFYFITKKFRKLKKLGSFERRGVL